MQLFAASENSLRDSVMPPREMEGREVAEFRSRYASRRAEKRGREFQAPIPPKSLPIKASGRKFSVCLGHRPPSTRNLGAGIGREGGKTKKGEKS
jgi:hypothetical protein